MENVLWDDQVIVEESNDVSLNQKLLDSGCSLESVQKLITQGYSQAM